MKLSLLSFLIFATAGQCISQTDEMLATRNIIEGFLKNKPIIVSSFQTNQEQYIPGDTIYFSAFVNYPDGAAPAGKVILRIKLRDPSGIILRNEFIAIVKGVTFGKIPLPDTIRSGVFRIEIAHNTADELKLLEHEVAVIKQMEIASEGLISFYPEGGHLIESVANNLAVYSTYSGPSIQIINKTGAIEDIVKLDSLGFGVFTIIPKPGQSYFAITRKGRVKLPFVEEDGVSLKLREVNPNGATFTVAIPPTSQFHKEPFSALLIADGKVSFATKIMFEAKDSIRMDIPVQLLSSGLNEILLVSGKNQLLTSRIFKANEGAFVEVRKSKPLVYQRDSVQLDISVKVRNGSPISALSIALINQPVFGDFRGRFPNSNRHLIRRSMTYNWPEVLRNDKSVAIQIFSKIKIRGRAVLLDSGQPVPDSTIVFCYLEKNAMGYEATTKLGFFELIFLYDFFGDDKLFVLTEFKDRYLRNVKIEWNLSSDTAQRNEIRYEILDVPSRYAQFRTNQKLIAQSYSYFTKVAEDGLAVENPNQEIEDEFMGADVTVHVADYLIFPTMTDLAREVVPNLQVRTVKGEEIVRVIFSSNTIKPVDDPLYIIDGRMTKDTKFFLSLKPIDLLSIKVEKDIYKLSRIGFLGKNGIVYVQSKKEKAITSAKLQGEYPIVGIIKPVVKANSKDVPGRHPDFRSTIYWNPYVTTDKSGRVRIPIKLSDDVGKMILRISGVTDSGVVFEEEKQIEVLYNKNLKN